jgi:DNA-binding NtrC family response regulator
MTKPRLIIIDDDKIFAELLAEVATFVGYEAEVVSDIQQFSEIYAKQSYGVMTLDISMPDSDGFEIIDELVKVNCQSKIIIISGHDEALMKSAETLAVAKGLNILTTMRKPIEVDDFEKVLEEAK